jgi:predicted nucleic acid-binding protein
VIVVDSSAVNAVLLGEREARQVLAVLEDHESLSAPALLPYEVANVLATAQRARRLDAREAVALLADFASWPWAFESHCTFASLEAVAQLCGSRGLTAYDASFLELAMRRNCPLLTFDVALRKAAKDEGVEVLPGTLR